MIFSKAPPLVSLDVPLVNNLPSERLRSAVLAPLLFNIFKEEVDACWISKVVEPPLKGTLVSAIVRLSNVLAPVNVWVDPRSAKVMVPVGKVADEPPDPVVNDMALVPDKVKLPSRVKVPVVQEGAPVPPERRA